MPIVVVPISVATLGLVFVPIFVWGTDHAAEFYGAFVAAIVAAGAVVGTTFLQARLASRERTALRKEEALIYALDTYVWLSKLISVFAFYETVVGNLLTNDPKFQMTASQLRSNINIEVRNELCARTPLAAKLPGKTGHQLLNDLYLAIGLLDTCRCSLTDPTFVVPPHELESRVEIAHKAVRILRFRRAQLALYLVAEGALNAPDEKDNAALGAVQNV